MAEITQEQREEAITWLKQNCLPLYTYAIDKSSGEDDMIQLYYKLKTYQFPFKPKEFVIGIDYTDKDKVIAGEEKVNITFQNPHLPGVGDAFAQQVVLELLQRLKA